MVGEADGDEAQHQRPILPEPEILVKKEEQNQKDVYDEAIHGSCLRIA